MKTTSFHVLFMPMTSWLSHYSGDCRKRFIPDRDRSSVPNRGLTMSPATVGIADVWQLLPLSICISTSTVWLIFNFCYIPFSKFDGQEDDDLYAHLKALQRQEEFLDIQEEYIKDEMRNLKRELIRAREVLTNSYLTADAEIQFQLTKLTFANFGRNWDAYNQSH